MSRRTTVLLAVGAALAVVVATAVVVVLLTRGGGSDDPQPLAEGAPAGLEEFYAQEVSWQDCGSGDDQCASFEAPVDYEDPDGETVELRMRRVPSTGDGERVLFVNPGGPGGSAQDYARTLAADLPRTVRDLYDVVGVDPRGVGESSPIDCLDDADFDEYVAGPVDPDEGDTALIEELRGETRTFGEGCRERSGLLAQHVSTLEAARDMDIARALLGQEQMDWFGASYGTQLGATYATEFPERVGRMVLDGAVDPAEDGVESSLSQAGGFQRAVEAYVADCVQDADCPLGTDADAAIDRLATLMDDLADRPLPTNQEGRELTQGNAFYGVAVTLYDQQTWQFLTQGLEAAFSGDGSVLLFLSDAYFSRQPDGSYDGNIGEVISVVSCLDQAERFDLDDTIDLLPRFEEASSVFGRTMGWGSVSCTDLGLESINPQVEIDATGSAPVVVIGTTGDPATPYENSQDLVDQLGEGVGVLLTREGEGHTAYSSGNQCIRDAVDAYLVDGTVPDDGTVCAEE